jgi:hypothetical protein
VHRFCTNFTIDADFNAKSIPVVHDLDEKDAVRVMDAVKEESSVVFGLLKAVSSAQLDLTRLGTYYQPVLCNTENLTRSISICFSIEKLSNTLNK